jgi:hypothetical protein
MHIKSVDLLKDPKSLETFGLTISILLESFIHLASKVELILVGKGDRLAIINHSKRMIYMSSLPLLLFYLSAVVISGVLYFGPYTPNAAKYETASDQDTYGDGYRSRNVAEAATGVSYGHDTMGSEWSIADLPLALCFIGYIFDVVHRGFHKLMKFDPKKRDVRDHFVPNNIDFQIHRYGEFTMLVLGESVLSLLIVDTTESKMYYFIACIGILNVIVIQAMKFDSEPSHADDHCLWRGVKASYWYSLLIQVLSMGLIGFGVSYKTMLSSVYENHVEFEDEDTSRRSSRSLAAAAPVTFRSIAALFCGCLCVVLISIELLSTSHKGFMETYKFLFRHDGSGLWKLHWRRVVVSLTKLSLLIFTATVPRWIVDDSLEALVGIGFGVSILFSLSRIIDWGYETDHHGVKKLIHAINIATQINLITLAGSNALSMSGKKPGENNKISSGNEKDYSNDNDDDDIEQGPIVYNA